MGGQPEEITEDEAAHQQEHQEVYQIEDTTNGHQYLNPSNIVLEESNEDGTISHENYGFIQAQP